jgi:hypothetical protein
MPAERVIDDRRFPRGSLTAQAGHELCLDRWLEERERRELAERSIRENAQAYEVLSEARDKEITRLSRRERNFYVAIAVESWLLLWVAIVVVVLVWR